MDALRLRDALQGVRGPGAACYAHHASSAVRQVEHGDQHCALPLLQHPVPEPTGPNDGDRRRPRKRADIFKKKPIQYPYTTKLTFYPLNGFLKGK